ncbi:hypothetical protein [Sedimentitalea sp.]|uniref:hypothetical protein n=1 Tax=Sedimentitalea sp. TaxID=2048915 RepID=UPI00329A38DB
MPVIINDLEIIIEGTEPAPSSTGAGPAVNGETDAIERALTPRTLEKIDRHRRDRAARIRGH